MTSSPVLMHFRKSGKGPDLVILHGLFGSSDNWISIARRLEEHFTIFMPDLRNHGQSPHTATHTYQDMTADLALFFELNDIEKAVVLGHSMGGKAAMMFAALYPEKISRLIIADIAPKSYISDTEEQEQKMLLEVMLNFDFTAFTSRGEIEKALAPHVSNLTLRQFLLKNIYRTKEGKFNWKINVPTLHYYLNIILKEANADFFAIYKPLIQYPVTFIRGLKSNYIQDSDVPAIQDIYPQARIIDLADAGHWLHSEQPEEFVRAVLEE